jgi:hypothetical protein
MGYPVANLIGCIVMILVFIFAIAGAVKWVIS